MKFNLKNRPKTCYKDETCVGDSDVEEWFEGLEKELTSRLSDAEFSETKSIKNDAIIELIKEILGEDSQ